MFIPVWGMYTVSMLIFLMFCGLYHGGKKEVILKAKYHHAERTFSDIALNLFSLEHDLERYVATIKNYDRELHKYVSQVDCMWRASSYEELKENFDAQLKKQWESLHSSLQYAHQIAEKNS